MVVECGLCQLIIHRSSPCLAISSFGHTGGGPAGHDIAPVSYGARHLGLVRAMQTLDLAAITRRSEADRALTSAIPDAAERGFLLQNLVFEDGRSRWRLNLAAIERNMPALVDFPAIPPGTISPGPALFVAGSRSDYVRPEYETAILHLFPAAAIVRIEGAGH